jgi:hypothetical protein
VSEQIVRSGIEHVQNAPSRKVTSGVASVAGLAGSVPGAFGPAGGDAPWVFVAGFCTADASSATAQGRP